jgi:hypothetical protein
MVWTPLGEKAVAITNATDAAKIAGAFVVLAGSDDSSGGLVTEDGFSVFIPEGRWAEAVAALEAGRPFEVAATEGKLPFSMAVQ